MNHDRQGVMTPFIRRAVEGKTIEVFGEGSQLRDLTYVSDAVDAFVVAAVVEEAHGQALNVGGREPVPLLEVAQLCQELAGHGAGVKTVAWPAERRAIDVGSVYLDSSRLTALTGWTPTVGLRDGLQRSIDFYRRFGHHYWAHD